MGNIGLHGNGYYWLHTIMGIIGSHAIMGIIGLHGNGYYWLTRKCMGIIGLHGYYWLNYNITNVSVLRMSFSAQLRTTIL